jgi:hypothetical protein
VFAIAVLQALREIILKMKTVEPYSEELRHAAEQLSTARE